MTKTTTTFEITRLDLIDTATFRRLNELRLSASNSMLLYFLFEGNHTETICLARRGTKIVGWGLVHPSWVVGVNWYEVHVFVDPKYRRQKIGSEIVKRLKRKKRKALRGSEWSSASMAFYGSLNIPPS